MRKLVLLVSLLVAGPVLAAEAKPITLEVGQQLDFGPAVPTCKDPKVAASSKANGAGVLKGVKAGKTTCSLTLSSGAKKTFTVTVEGTNK